MPSEKAFAYKMRLEAMKRQAGRPRKENVSPVGTNLRTDEQIAQETVDSVGDSVFVDSLGNEIKRSNNRRTIGRQSNASSSLYSFNKPCSRTA